jgi:adenosylcobyric acid synthase
MDQAIIRHARQGKSVIGICGGYQMLARSLRDPEHLESNVPASDGLGLLDMEVAFLPQKTTVQSAGLVLRTSGIMSGLDGMAVEGYEIHMGTNRFGPGVVPCIRLERRGETTVDTVDGVCNERGNVLGTYLHGFFDNSSVLRSMMNNIRKSKGLTPVGAPVLSFAEFKEREYDRLASVARSSLDTGLIYRILRGQA